jgi:hypothetical protein
MATAHGKNFAFKLDDSGGTLRQLTGVSKVTGLPGGYPTDDVTASGDAGGMTVVGLPDNTFGLEGPYDNTASTGSHTVISGLPGLDATQTFEYSPLGTTGGYPKYGGECRCTKYTVDADVKGALRFSAELHVEGAVTLGTN